MYLDRYRKCMSSSDYNTSDHYSGTDDYSGGDYDARSHNYSDPGPM
jgi:hypothetical protein